jgi:hypothetical protein
MAMFNARKYYIPIPLDVESSDYSYSLTPVTHEDFDVAAIVEYVGFIKWSYRYNRIILIYNVLPDNEFQTKVYVVDQEGFIYRNGEAVWVDRFTILIGCDAIDGFDISSTKASIYRGKYAIGEAAITKEE